MRVVRVVLIALALLLLLAAGAVVALVSPAGQRAVQNAFNSWATEQLGRTASIDGALTLELGRDIVIAATNVRLANVEWGSRVDMLVANRVAIRVDGMSLLSRSPTLIVDEVDIDGLDLLLERNDRRREQLGVSSDQRRPRRRRGCLRCRSWSIAYRCRGAHVQFIGPRLDRPLTLVFEQITQQRGAGDMLEFAAAGSANDAALNITGQIGPFANLVAGKAISTSVDGHVGQLNLALKARIDDLARLVDSEADLDISGPDAAYVASTFGVRNLGDGPFNFTLSVSPAPDGQGVRGSVVGKIGQFDISGDGELSDPTEMARLVLRTEISGPDASLLAGIVGLELPPEQFHLSATIRRTGTLLEIDQAKLDLLDSAFSLQGSVKRIDTLSGNDVTAHLVGANVEKFRKLLRIPGLATGPFDVTLRLHPSDTGADLMELTSKTALLYLSASGPLGDYPDYFGTRVQFTARGDDIRPWAQTLGVTAPRAPFSTRGQAQWSRAGLELRAATLSVADDTLNLDGAIGTSKNASTNLRFGLQGKRLSDAAAYVRWANLSRATVQGCRTCRHSERTNAPRWRRRQRRRRPTAGRRRNRFVAELARDQSGLHFQWHRSHAVQGARARVMRYRSDHFRHAECSSTVTTEYAFRTSASRPLVVTPSSTPTLHYPSVRPLGMWQTASMCAPTDPTCDCWCRTCPMQTSSARSSI